MGVAATGAMARPARATPHRPLPPADTPRSGSDQPDLDPDTRPDAIPPALWNRLVLRRDRLEHQGAVFCEAEKGRRPRYRLRYRCTEGRVDATGYTTTRDRQRSIELGTAEVARTVEHLLAVWRADDVRFARMRRLYAASKAEAERDERRRLRAQVEAAHAAAIAEDAERSRLAALAAEEDRNGVEHRDAASIPQLPPRLAIVPCYRPLSWREARNFLIDCMTVPPDPDDERHERNTRVLAEYHEEVAAAHIPNELLDKLLSLKEILVEYGAILKRRESDRRPSYRLRVRAPHPDYARTHRAIPIRDDLVDWVELLLSAWRAPRQAAEHHRRNAERRLAHERRQMGRLLTEFRATARDQPELLQEAIDMASVIKSMIRDEAPFRLVPV